MILRMIGVALIILGTAALVYQGFTYTTQESVVDFGPVEVTAEEKKTVPLHPILGIAALAGGAALIFVDGKRRRSADNR